MAWCDIGNGAGNWESDDDHTVWLKDLRAALAELCYAANEREMLLGRGCIEDDGSTFPNGYVSPWASWVDWPPDPYSELLTYWKCRHVKCAAAIDSEDTTVTVEYGDVLDLTPPFYVWMSVGGTDEYMKVTSRDGNVLTVTRGQLGSSAQDWGDAAIDYAVYYVTTFPTAADIDRSTGINMLVPWFITDLQTSINKALGATGWGDGWHWGLEFTAHYTDASHTSLLTRNDALAAGSYGGTWLGISRVQQSSAYLQIREVLDQMKYLVVYPELDYDSAQSHYDLRCVQEMGGPPPALQLAWEAACVDTPEENTLLQASHVRFRIWSSDPAWWNVSIHDNAQAAFSTQNLHGLVDSGFIRLRKHHSALLDTAITITLNGTITEDIEPADPQDEDVEKASATWVSTGATTILPIDIEVPETCPFPELIWHEDIGYLWAKVVDSEWDGAEPAGVSEPCSRFYLDITSELTYG